MTENQLKNFLIVIAIVGLATSCGYLFYYRNPPLPEELTVYKGVLSSYTVSCDGKNAQANVFIQEGSAVVLIRVPCGLDWSALQYGKEIEIKTYPTIMMMFYQDIEVWRIESAGKVLLDEPRAILVRKRMRQINLLGAIGFLCMLGYQLFGPTIRKLFDPK